MAASDEHKVHKFLDRPGLMIEGHALERMGKLIVDTEGGDVALRVVIDRLNGIDEILQYLGPIEAMQISQAFHDCAIAALKGRAKW